MHTIDNPDIGGVGCNVRQHSVRLPAFAFRTLPNFPNFRLGAVAGSVCDTLGYSATSPQKAQVLKVFPNPTSGIIHIENLPPQARVVVYDALGREVFRKENNNTNEITLPLSLTNGVYALSIFYENVIIYSSKLVLVRE